MNYPERFPKGSKLLLSLKRNWPRRCVILELFLRITEYFQDWRLQSLRKWLQRFPPVFTGRDIQLYSCTLVDALWSHFHRLWTLKTPILKKISKKLLLLCMSKYLGCEGVIRKKNCSMKHLNVYRCIGVPFVYSRNKE